MWGITGVQREAVLAARSSIVTVEEIVDELTATGPNHVVLPTWTVTAVAQVPGGSHPSYSMGFTTRDNAFYTEWDAISRDRDTFSAWMREFVIDTPDHAAYLDKISSRAPMVETGPDQATFTPDEMMTVTAARGLRNGQVCFVGIGLPSEAANLARISHAPDVVLIYESGTIGTRPGDPPPLHWRRRAGREGRPRGQRPRGLQLLAPGRPDRCRVPLGCPDRPIRKPEQHRHRLVRPAPM